MRLFVQSLGWKLVSASGDIDIRALKDNINLLAKLDSSGRSACRQWLEPDATRQALT